jgi:hypothetical protein
MPDVPDAAADASAGIVETWFGPRFQALHPLLRALHRHGGKLEGAIDVHIGRGFAGILGKRIAQRLGVPPSAGRHWMQVDIRQDARALHWDRCFDHGSWMRSRFEPSGTWPQGCWREISRPVELRLTVDVVDAGWHWRTLGIRVSGVPLPRRLLPRMRAYKCATDGRYRFHVGFALPLIGDLLAYSGTLDAIPDPSPII